MKRFIAGQDRSQHTLFPESLEDYLTKGPKKGSSKLELLCRKVKTSNSQTAIVRASFGLLQRSIRNRDAHAYVPNVRQGHHHMAYSCLTDALNLLVQWLPNGAGQVNSWRSDAESFIASLQR